MEAKRQIELQASEAKRIYDGKYKKFPIYKENELARIKNPVTKIGLKKKLRNDKWGNPVKIVRVSSPQNIEVEIKDKRKVVNVKKVKKATCRKEVIRDFLRLHV